MTSVNDHQVNLAGLLDLFCSEIRQYHDSIRKLGDMQDLVKSSSCAAKEAVMKYTQEATDKLNETAKLILADIEDTMSDKQQILEKNKRLCLSHIHQSAYLSEKIYQAIECRDGHDVSHSLMKEATHLLQNGPELPHNSCDFCLIFTPNGKTLQSLKETRAIGDVKCSFALPNLVKLSCLGKHLFMPVEPSLGLFQVETLESDAELQNELEFVVFNPLGKAVVDLHLTKQRSGLYTMHFSPCMVGAYRCEARMQGVQINGSPAVVNIHKGFSLERHIPVLQPQISSDLKKTEQSNNSLQVTPIATTSGTSLNETRRKPERKSRPEISSPNEGASCYCSASILSDCDSVRDISTGVNLISLEKAVESQVSSKPRAGDPELKREFKSEIHDVSGLDSEIKLEYSQNETSRVTSSYAASYPPPCLPVLAVKKPDANCVSPTPRLLTPEALTLPGASQQSPPTVSEAGSRPTSPINPHVAPSLVSEYSISTSPKGVSATMCGTLGFKGRGAMGCLLFPIGVTTGADGDIIVCDSGNHMVKVFSKHYHHKFTVGEAMKRPSAAVVNSKGEMFIKDDYQIYVFDPNGVYLRVFGKKELNRPYGLVLNARGQVVTIDHVDRSRVAVAVFEQSGHFLYKSSPIALSTLSHGRPKCRFLTTHSDKLYLVDLGSSVVHVTDMKGDLVDTFGGFGGKAGEFREPSGITADQRGNLLIADSKNNRIQVFSPDCKYLSYIHLGAPIKRPSDIHLTKDGHLLVSNYLEHCVKVFTLV